MEHEIQGTVPARVELREGLEIRTPLGYLTVGIDQPERIEPILRKPNRFREFTGARAFEFERSGVQTGVCWGETNPELPDGMDVTGTIAVVIRQKIEAKTGPWRWWVAPNDDFDGTGSREVETGERLQACSWYADGTKVTVGTEDGDALNSRANQGDYLPHRIAGEIGFDNVSAEDGGAVAIVLPCLESGDLVQFHFVLSWKTSTEPSALDTWFAVDMSYEEILADLDLRL